MGVRFKIKLSTYIVGCLRCHQSWASCLSIISNFRMLIIVGRFICRQKMNEVIYKVYYILLLLLVQKKEQEKDTRLSRPPAADN